MLNIKTLPNGLRLTCGNDARSELAQSDYRESLVGDWLHEKFAFINPEDIGALTDAPILCDCDGIDYSDDGERSILPAAQIYWFPDYMVRDPWQELASRGRIDFIKAGE